MSSAVTTKRRVVVVTGGANGIGEAICREFVHSEHAIVVCGDLDQKKGDALAAQFDTDSFVFVQVDCGKREDCERQRESARVYPTHKILVAPWVIERPKVAAASVGTHLAHALRTLRHVFRRG